MFPANSHAAPGYKSESHVQLPIWLLPIVANSERAQFYSVSKKRHEVSTKSERESQDLSDIILSICIFPKAKKKAEIQYKPCHMEGIGMSTCIEHAVHQFTDRFQFQVSRDHEAIRFLPLPWSWQM
ncbi:hypothetical protein ACN38_g3804 [Penicillium nordicum]|uniref:Uncharacterized protein n=1 Tax=Penicillium nordicum TaxID=229535 RepID=A0A0M8P523_9EURO|nr:hypothetical protein ACN38_g3804 [Penicillium nordicum]